MDLSNVKNTPSLFPTLPLNVCAQTRHPNDNSPLANLNAGSIGTLGPDPGTTIFRVFSQSQMVDHCYDGTRWYIQVSPNLGETYRH